MVMEQQDWSKPQANSTAMKWKAMWNWFGDLVGTTIVHPQYLVKCAEHQCIKTIKTYAKGTFLDIGCGRQWYRVELEPLFKTYYALDHPTISKRYQTFYPIELKADATRIPLPNSSVDVVMMNMVLEHLPNPEKALQEVQRVLKPSGTFILCTVENYPGHDFPYNYYHWTRYGLKTIFSRNGFQIESLRSFGNVWQVLVVYLNVYLMQVVKRLTAKKRTVVVGLILLFFSAPLMIGGNIAAGVAGRNKNSSAFSLAHLVVARPKKDI